MAAVCTLKLPPRAGAKFTTLSIDIWGVPIFDRVSMPNACGFIGYL